MIKKLKRILEQVNERMRATGKPELTMEDIAAMQVYGKEAGEQGKLNFDLMPHPLYDEFFTYKKIRASTAGQAGFTLLSL